MNQTLEAKGGQLDADRPSPLPTQYNETRPALACPVHKLALDRHLSCTACGKAFPVFDGIPILINEANSVFRIADFLAQQSAYGGASDYAGTLDTRGGLRQIYRRVMHALTESSPPTREFDVDRSIEHILKTLPNAEILVIGAGDMTVRGNATYTDVAFGRNVTCVADAHDLPFLPGSFDACVAIAVLEHVADPYRCVEEIVRVLRPGGYVYAETPFLSPVHMGAHDFTRFTYLGHRRLFRYFDDVKSGMVGGPGSSAMHVGRHMLTDLTDGRLLRKWLRLFSVLVTLPLRWLDFLGRSSQSAYDSAAGFYFFGRLREKAISDYELLRQYRGGQ
jgi:SAM-dependent methyltransferase